MALTGAVVLAGVGLAAAGAAGGLQLARRGEKSGVQLIGNDLANVPKFYFSQGGYVPHIVECCCHELEQRINDSRQNLDWVGSLRAADPDQVEGNKKTSDIVDQFRDPKTRNPSKIKLKDLTTPQVWQILFYYLDTLPDPLCTGTQYESFLEVDNNFKDQTETSAEWREQVSKLIGSQPGRQRMTLLRVLKTSNKLVSACPEEKKKEVMDALVDCLAPVCFSPAYPVEEVENENSPTEPAAKVSRLQRLRKKKTQEPAISPRVHHPEGNHLPATFSMIVNDFPEMERTVAKHPMAE